MIETLPLLRETISAVSEAPVVQDMVESEERDDQKVTFETLSTPDAKVLFTVCVGVKTSLALKDFANAYQLLSLLVPTLKIQDIREKTDCSENAVKVAKRIARSAESFPGAASAAKPKCVRIHIHPDSLNSFMQWFQIF